MGYVNWYDAGFFRPDHDPPCALNESRACHGFFDAFPPITRFSHNLPEEK